MKTPRAKQLVMKNACPAREQLERLLKEELPDAEHSAVELHVEACISCQQELDRILDSDRKYCLPPESLSADAQSVAPVADALERLIPSSPFDRNSAVRAGQLLFHFPGPPTLRGPLGQLRSYHMIELLGAGATGYVFKAYDEDLERWVAIKVIRPELAVVASSRVRFLREARAAAKIRHEHVVGIYKVESVPEFALPFIVMEYVEGGTLAARLQREPDLPVDEAVGIVYQVAIGLSAAHDQGFVHRDIKPSNILLQMARVLPNDAKSEDHKNGAIDVADPVVADSLARDPVYVAKITDFGLARVIEAADYEGRQRLTRTGHILGTPAYMSPEHILAPESVGPQSDVYSLGVVLYELLTSQLPFAGTAHQILLQVVQADPVAPRLHSNHIPAALSDIVLACLAKESKLRYLSARELAVELERWQAGQRVRVRPLSMASKLARWCRRNSALASAWAVTGLLGVGLLLLGFPLAHFRVAADRRLENEQGKTNSIRTENQSLAADLALERGLAQCDQGRIHQGLLWLARALELAPLESNDLQWSIRAQLAAWNRTTAKLQRVFPRQGVVRAVAFSQDGSLLLTHCDGHDPWQWNIASGRCINAPGMSSTISSDGYRTYAVPDRNHVIVQGMSAVSFSPDGRTVLIGLETGAVWVVDINNGVRHDLQNCHDGEVTALAFSNDGSCFLTGGQDKTAQMWKSGTLQPEPLGPRLKHPSTVEAVAFSPDGRTLITGCADKKARLWDADSGVEVGSPLEHEETVTAVAFSPNGQVLLTTCKDHLARLWDATSRKMIGSPLFHNDKIYAGAFSADGRLIATGGNDCTVRVWDASTGTPVGAPLMHDGPVYAVAFSLDGRRLGTGGEDLVARLWELPDAQSLEHRVTPSGRTADIAFNSDGNKLAVAVEVLTNPPFVQVFDPQSWDVIGAPLRHAGLAHAVTFRPDGKVVLTGGRDDRTARFWHSATGEPFDPPIQLDDSLFSIAFSPDGRVVLTGDQANRICFWDAITHSALRQPLILQGAVCALAFSPDGKLILSGSWDKTAQLWDAETGAQRGSPLRHKGPVVDVSFSPNGKFVVTGSHDSTAQIWDTETSDPRGPPFVHRQSVLTVAFSPDGRMVATGSEDHMACIWDLSTHYRIGPPLVHRNNVSAVAFSPNGHVLVTAGEESVVRTWTVPTPVEGEPEQIRLWVQVATGLELEDDGRVRLLPGEIWSERRQRLERLGGPPNP